MKKTSEVYKKLYHYTTWEGLQGIIENQTLWATNYKFLNDYSEIIFFKDKLISLIYPYVLDGFKELIKHRPDVKQKINRKGGLQKVVQHDAKGLVDAQYEALGDEIYILSFCGQAERTSIANNGLLSQWRGYGTGGGAALVFDTKKLEEILAIEAKRFEYSAVIIADIIYSDDEQKLQKELSDDLAILADIAKLFFNHKNLSKKIMAEAEKGFYPFVKCISRYKHYGFSEENEVRVVALPTVIDGEYLKLAKENGLKLMQEKKKNFRRKKGKSIPYIELFNSDDIDLPIEKIIIGPHKQKETRAAALRKRLRKTKIETTCSDIPYVG